MSSASFFHIHRKTLTAAAVCVGASFTFAGEVVPTASSGTSSATAQQNLSFFGDFRNRFESDWDSQRPDGTLRDDRDRYRIRARLGVEWKPTDHWLVRLRGRTGSHLSQQSPHLTLHDFDDGPTDDFDVALDQWFVQGSFDHISLWAGRNEFPFFYATESQEILWDKDATLTGGFFSWKISDLLTANAGGFALPEGMDRWSGSLWSGQLVTQCDIATGWTLKGAASFLGIEGGGSSDRLLDGNGTRDYQIGVLSAQSLWTLEQNPIGLRYVRLGVDGIRNFADYSSTDADAVTARYHDATDGFVASIAVGKGKPSNRQTWDWELDYTYGHVEKLAINASYAQDDWMRWGSGSQTASSDFKAHQLGLRVWLWKDKHHSLDLHARAYFAESLSSVEDGNRFRIDLNYGFKF